MKRRGKREKGKEKKPYRTLGKRGGGGKNHRGWVRVALGDGMSPWCHFVILTK